MQIHSPSPALKTPHLLYLTHLFRDGSVDYYCDLGCYLVHLWNFQQINKLKSFNQCKEDVFTDLLFGQLSLNEMIFFLFVCIRKYEVQSQKKLPRLFCLLKQEQTSLRVDSMIVLYVLCYMIGDGLQGGGCQNHVIFMCPWSSMVAVSAYMGVKLETKPLKWITAPICHKMNAT